MSLPKACIFDLDGVIVDTVPAHYVAWKTMADELHISFSEDDNEQLKGVSRIDSMKRILEMGAMTRSDEEILEMTARKNDIYVDIISKMTFEDILPGVTSFIEKLKDRGVAVAIGSSSKNTPTILKAVGLDNAFDVVVDGNQILHSKPHTEVFLKDHDRVSYAPQDCVLCDDAISGVQAAKNGNMKCIGVGNPEVLGEADKVIRNLEDTDLDILTDL